MIAERVAKQSEVDAALLKGFGLRPTGQYTSDKTQQLYTNKEGKGFILPAENQGYSYYSIGDIMAHMRQISTGANVVGIHTFVASDGESKQKKSED